MMKVRAMNWLLTDENMATLMVIAGFCLFKIVWHLLSREEHPYSPNMKGGTCSPSTRSVNAPTSASIRTKTHRLTVKGGAEACKLIL
jgi:hypothetical protein